MVFCPIIKALNRVCGMWSCLNVPFKRDCKQNVLTFYIEIVTLLGNGKFYGDIVNNDDLWF